MWVLLDNTHSIPSVSVMQEKNLFVPEHFNARKKLIPKGEGGAFEAVQIMVADKQLFHPGFEVSTTHDISGNRTCVRVDEAITADRNNETAPPSEKAAKRAAAKLRDYILCNPDMNVFFTLTYNPDTVERTNYTAVISRFNLWWDNQVRRRGAKYVAVAEYHKDGKSIHFHGLCNDSVKLVDSGTVRCAGHKKPIKRATADRYKIPPTERQIVYNVLSWHHGFSTAVVCNGSVEAVAAYIGKYITKSGVKVGGRYYYHGGKLAMPKYEYFNTDYKSFDGAEVAFTENLHAKFLSVNSDLTFSGK